jgi:predicted nuclease of predicted toxin-antitoxin system
MTFLADENFPMSSVRVLRDAGHDVVSIQESAPSNVDEDVLERAVRLNAVLLTFDRDFGTLIFHKILQAPRGVVYYRIPTIDPIEPAAILLRLIDHYKLDQMFTVVKVDDVRQRELPRV